ncbi:amidohydrolase family protein [Chloroflexota bacterium]
MKLTTENPIDSVLPICDPHHHLWAHTTSTFVAAVGDHYLVEEFLQGTAGGHNIVQTVFVECGQMYHKSGPQEMQPVGETEFVQDTTAQSASGKYGMTTVAAGIVGFADLTLGAAVAPVLEAHISAGRGRFRGIRHKCTWDANPDIKSDSKVKVLTLDPKFREGFAYLQKFGLSFDAWQYYTQLMDLVDLARAFPYTAIIVNHVGGPLGIGPYAGKHDEVFQEWKRGMIALATCSNVIVKLGGLGVPTCGFGWDKRAKPPSSTELANAMAPYYNLCIEQFGVDRCMFESNFPVDMISYSYTVLWNAFKRITEYYSPEERAALFRDTAVRVYRLASGHEGAIE